MDSLLGMLSQDTYVGAGEGKFADGAGEEGSSNCSVETYCFGAQTVDPNELHHLRNLPGSKLQLPTTSLPNVATVDAKLSPIGGINGSKLQMRRAGVENHVRADKDSQRKFKRGSPPQEINERRPSFGEEAVRLSWTSTLPIVGSSGVPKISL